MIEKKIVSLEHGTFLLKNLSVGTILFVIGCLLCFLSFGENFVLSKSENYVTT